MVVNADAPYNTFDEWKAYVEENPGTFRVGVPGASSVHNLCMMGLKVETGLDYNTISYPKAEEISAALMGGHIEGAVLGFSELKSGIDSGDFKLIVFTTDNKAEGYEEIASLAELGYEATGVSFQGICIKAGTDPDVVAKMKAAFDKVFADPEVIEQLKKANIWYEGTLEGSEAFTQRVINTYDYYEKVLTETGLMQELYD